ncbi:DUF421 domain-containing protein [Pseudobacillus badius]|uniref:DUF421 domain-containing protein n=1 Tax=Bacillus badius TaxID=1455 RepID=UPI0007B03A5F|nr:DUF421 domain-containing protein [Bacillus badius]KZN98715.1 hypothetical protein A4244_06275 [Bacillus badius]OCS83653.1 hypothetical protein A6M11_06280 [Bacillus badius]OVE53060.1 DUF421 domain-containing protein [Bacillus badius]TDW05103.1 uncharacterized membrane protein YcaP (DUF421 family) [Bacillus badius]GLY10083.1 UPF0702 transmembrane protein YrbG [Bacillus badius]
MVYWTIIFRAIFLYIVILFVFRLMGRREIGELSILDLVVFLMIGEMAVIAIEQPNDPLMHTLVPIFILVIIQISLAYISLKSVRFREFIDGKPEIIIKHGKIDEKAMKRHRYNYHDLLLQLREKDIRHIDDIEFAILETSGSLSVLPKEKTGKAGSFTLPIVLDGDLHLEHLQMIGKTEQWLRRELKKRGYKNIKDISFCSFHDGRLFIDEKER